MTQLPPRLARAGLIIAPWLLILALWYAIRASGLVNPALVPAPHQVAAKAVELAQGRLWSDIYMSTQRVFIGVTLGVALAVQWASASAGTRACAVSSTR